MVLVCGSLLRELTVWECWPRVRSGYRGGLQVAGAAERGTESDPTAMRGAGTVLRGVTRCVDSQADLMDYTGA